MDKIIFVYNKDAGFMNGIFDFFHKMMKPASYNCSLCMVTYNYFGMRSAWKAYLNSLPLESEFYHKDEFISKFDSNFKLPAVFIQKEKDLIQIVTNEELDKSDLVEMMKLIKDGIRLHLV